MSFFANKIQFLLLLLIAIISAQEGSHDEATSDNIEADSQTRYRFVAVPVKSIQHFSNQFKHDTTYSYKSTPSYKSRPQIFYTTSPKAPYSVFSPNPKFTAYANHLKTNSRSKDNYAKFTLFPKKYQIAHKPIHPNFNSDLATVKLPLSENQHPQFSSFQNPDLTEFKNNFKLQEVPDLYRLQQEFLESASPKQVQSYLEAQQKEIDDQTELQLLNDPNPAAKGIYQQFLKAKEDEKIEQEYLEEMQKHAAHQQPGTSYIPINIEERETIKKSVTPGLRHYRTGRVEPSSAYQFEITLP